MSKRTNLVIPGAPGFPGHCDWSSLSWTRWASRWRWQDSKVIVLTHTEGKTKNSWCCWLLPALCPRGRELELSAGLPRFPFQSFNKVSHWLHPGWGAEWRPQLVYATRKEIFALLSSFGILGRSDCSFRTRGFLRGVGLGWMWLTRGVWELF